MDYADDFWCKLYIDVDVSQDELVNIIADLLNGTVALSTISTPYIEIFVRRNELFDELGRKQYPDGFLYFRYYVDIEASVEQKHENQIALIAKLLEQFWSMGLPAVAACDYEDELPEGGGNKAASPPWKVATHLGKRTH